MEGRSKLRIVVIGVTLVVTAKLFSTATAEENWPGFFYSFAHVLIVAFGSYLALKNAKI